MYPRTATTSRWCVADDRISNHSINPPRRLFLTALAVGLAIGLSGRLAGPPYALAQKAPDETRPARPSAPVGKASTLTAEEERKAHGEHAPPRVVDKRFMIAKELPSPEVTPEEVKKLRVLRQKTSLSAVDRELIARYVTHVFAEMSRDPENCPEKTRLLRSLRRGATPQLVETVGRAIEERLPEAMANHLAVRVNALILASVFPYEPAMGALCDIVTDEKQHDGVKYWAVKVIGVLGGEPIKSVKRENLALDTLVTALKRQKLDCTLAREIVRTLGLVGRPDALGTEMARGKPRAEVETTVLRLLCNVASDPDAALDVRQGPAYELDVLDLRVNACEACPVLRAGPRKKISAKPVTTALARVSQALCDRMFVVPKFLELPGAVAQREPDLVKRREDLYRRQIFLYSYRVYQSLDRLEEGWGGNDACTKKLDELLRRVSIGMEKAWKQPEANKSKVDGYKKSLEKWMTSCGEKPAAP